MQDCAFFGSHRIENSGMTALSVIFAVQSDSSSPTASEGVGLDDLLRSLLT